nr:MAG: zinc-binding loop region of homing endonuclease [Bacteriophage sp.]UWG30146.1 MAG: zinc-binding loop region of homing endonuclease [Bacteriophage sp.]
MRIIRILFLYKDGNLIRCCNSRKARAGEVAGAKHKSGYIQVRVLGKMMKAHRVVWWINYGFIPDHLQIDHKNHVRDDNRVENLELKSNAENHKNMSLYKSNKSGAHGVRWNSKFNRWDVYIVVGGKKCYVGVFRSLDDAIAAKLQAEKDNGFHRNHGK